MYSLTIFKNQYDNKTDKVVELDTWTQFETLLINLSKKEGQKGGNNSSPLISPARYFPNTTRSNKNVNYWGGWAAVDVDDFDSFDGSFSADVVVPNLQKICGQYQFTCYSTASSSPKHPKFRLVFPLTRILQGKEIKHFWYALNKQLGDLGDAQTKDLSRMYYVPAQYPEAFNFLFSNEGKFMDPQDLMSAWEYKEKSGGSFLDRLPEALQQAVVQHRKNQLTNTDITWTSYNDCPFFPKRLGLEYRALTGTGWYSKMYQIMVAIAGRAVERQYPITTKQIADLIREFDNDTGRWYENRPLEVEADRALEYVYKNQ